ncbi:hypothetical protein ACLKA7_010477 [Drosophila subpalustris]
MRSLGKLVLLLLATLLSATAGEEQQCGNLDERLLFSRDTSTEPAEYPWMGILFHLRGASFENTGCSVVILAEFHVLTTASCVRRFNNRTETAAVRLGIWNETHTPDEEYICNAKGFCVPGPVQHSVAEIKVHPQADKDTGDNDLAILRLTERIKWTTYKRPLCLEPISPLKSLIGRNFHFGGFEQSNFIKGKGLTYTLSREYCTKISEASSARPENQFCAYPVKRTKFYEGAALMGINIVNEVPKSFYLVGLLSEVVVVRQTTVFGFQDVAPWRIDFQTGLQMQLLLGLFCVTLGTSLVNSENLQESKCGYINEEQLLKQNEFAVPTEHQWLARITYENGHEAKLPNDGCLGVLISKRNVLAPAHCFVQYDGQADAYSVQLGVWNKSSNAHEVSCDKDGYCVLPAQDIPLAEIAVHPEYDPLTLKHSLAVLTLQRAAKMTPTVMPICMPPPSMAKETLVGQMFVVAGLPIKDPLKHKTWVNTISLPYCQKEYSSLITSSTTVCGYQDRTKTYYQGAPLVGIQVESNVPQNFYLVGLLIDSKNKNERIVSSFLDVRPYLNFIKLNTESLIVRNNGPQPRK